MSSKKKILTLFYMVTCVNVVASIHEVAYLSPSSSTSSDDSQILFTSSQSSTSSDDSQILFTSSQSSTSSDDSQILFTSSHESEETEVDGYTLSKKAHRHYVQFTEKPTKNDLSEIEKIYLEKINSDIINSDFLENILDINQKKVYKAINFEYRPLKRKIDDIDLRDSFYNTNDDVKFLNEMLRLHFYFYECKQGLFHYLELKTQLKKKIDIGKINNKNTSGTPFIIKVCATRNYVLFKYLLAQDTLEINQTATSGISVLHYLIKQLDRELTFNNNIKGILKFLKKVGLNSGYSNTTKKMLKRVLQRDDLDLELKDNNDSSIYDKIDKKNKKKIKKIIDTYKFQEVE